MNIHHEFMYIRKDEEDFEVWFLSHEALLISCMGKNNLLDG